MWIKVCNSHSNKETELFAEPLNGHGAFFDDFPLVLSAKTEYWAPRWVHAALRPIYICRLSATIWIIPGLSLLARKNPCVIFSEQAKEAKATLFPSVEYAVSTTSEGKSLNEAAFWKSFDLSDNVVYISLT